MGAAKVKGRVLFIGRAETAQGARRAPARPSPAAAAAPARDAGRSPARPAGRSLEASRLGPGRRSTSPGVEALGWVADDEKVAQLAQAEVVCAPSLAAESFGIVLAEAMAAGVPVVASDLPGYRSVLRDGEAGRLVPPNDGPLLADALYDVLRNPRERARMAAAGLAAARQLSWTHVTKQILAAYEDALEAGPKPYGEGSPGGAWLGRAILSVMI